MFDAWSPKSTRFRRHCQADRLVDGISFDYNLSIIKRGPLIHIDNQTIQQMVFSSQENHVETVLVSENWTAVDSKFE